MGRNQVVRLYRSEQGSQPLVGILHTNKEVEHTFVNAERTEHEWDTCLGSDFDQPPATERSGGCHAAPMRVRERRHRQTERWIGTCGIPLGCSAQSGDFGVKVDAGAQDENRAFEPG